MLTIAIIHRCGTMDNIIQIISGTKNIQLDSFHFIVSFFEAFKSALLDDANKLYELLTITKGANK
jgi:hypothetical protein